MNTQSILTSISRCDDEIARQEKNLADEFQKEFQIMGKINRVESSVNKNTSPSQLQSKQREVSRYRNDLANISKKKADIQKKIAREREKRNGYQQQLHRENESERRRQKQADLMERQRTLMDNISLLRHSDQKDHSKISSSDSKEYDFFIAHASEDKDEFVRPLAHKLVDLGAQVWYDEFQLKVGDSLRRSIDNGLAKSKFGIVVLSMSFFSKGWGQYELDGLVTKEINGGKVILPIWHRVSVDDVKKYSLSLADKLALNTSIQSLDDIAKELMTLITE